MKSLKYKALISDVDGTLMPNSLDAMPSEKVRDIINLASKKIHIGIATSRPLKHVSHVINFLTLTSPCIVNGGCQIYSPVTNDILWSKKINPNAFGKIADTAEKLKTKIIINNGTHDITSKEEINPRKVLQVWIPKIKPQKAEKLFSEISKISTISVYKIPSWEVGKIDLTITHSEATKQHGILEVAKILGISTKEIIGVGDGYNDFPLMMACGLKIAMGNAVDDIKEIADYIAPPVEKDGMVDVIKRFIL